jgi:archaellum component FlaC
MKKIIIIILLVINNWILAQVPTCPIKIGGQEVFSKNSFLGDKICPALSNLDKLADGLSKGVNDKVNEAKDAMKKVTDGLMKDVVDQEAVTKLLRATNGIYAIKDDVADLIKDAERGVPAAYKAMQTGFMRAAEDFTTLFSVTKKTMQCLAKLQELVPLQVQVLKDLQSIVSSLQSATPEIKQQVTILKKALEEINKDFEKLAKINPEELLSAAQNLATGLVPYLTNCGGCAVALAESIKGTSQAIAGIGSGSVTSETGVGALVGIAVAAFGGIQAAVATLGSAPTCTYVTANSGKVISFINDANTFIQSTVTIINSLASNTENVLNATQALATLGKLLADENKPKLEAIQKNVVSMFKIVAATAKDLERDIVPQVSKFVGKKIQQISNDVTQLQKCYYKVMDVAKLVTDDIINGVTKISVLATETIDVKKLAANVENELKKTVTAAGNEAKEIWNTLSNIKDDMYKSIFGDKPNDAIAVGFHIASLGNKIDAIVNKLATAASSITNVVTNAVNEGKKAITADVTNKVKTIKQKYDDIGNGAKDFSFKILKVKSRINLSQKERESAAEKTQKQLLQAIEAIPSLGKLVIL